MKQNKIVIILASVILVLSLCIASKEASIQYILADMYYGNVSGWLEDADGTSYLQLISGGKLSLPDFHPFENDPTIESNLNSAMG